MRALLLVALLGGANPGAPPEAGMEISVTVPETVWNTPGHFALTLLPDGGVQVVDSRLDSPGWSIVRQVSPGRLTMTVLS
jgi:hypothetical protein